MAHGVKDDSSILGFRDIPAIYVSNISRKHDTQNYIWQVIYTYETQNDISGEEKKRSTHSSTIHFYIWAISFHHQLY